jgi:FRG domain
MTSSGGADTSRDRDGFCEKKILNWDDFHKAVFEFNSMTPLGWLYRGQTDDWPVTTSIERALLDWNIGLKEALKIEFQTIREFRRRTLDPLHERIQRDTLFCLALMQHHGAPTRLLDGSYSPFVAAAFAMEKGPKRRKAEGEEIVPVVWCFSLRWLRDKIKKKTKQKNAFEQRDDDNKRNDATFLKLYNVGPNAKKPEQFVNSENAFHLNERLTTQQGVFLCPGDLTLSFMNNIKSMDG